MPDRKKLLLKEDLLLKISQEKSNELIKPNSSSRSSKWPHDFLENFESIARFITVFICSSPVVEFHTPNIPYINFLLHNTRFMHTGTCTQLGLSNSDNTTTTMSFRSVINWLVICFVEVLIVTG